MPMGQQLGSLQLAIRVKQLGVKQLGSGLLILEIALQLSQRLHHRAGRIVCHPLNGVAHGVL